jgi:hypothetical protein
MHPSLFFILYKKSAANANPDNDIYFTSAPIISTTVFAEVKKTCDSIPAIMKKYRPSHKRVGQHFRYAPRKSAEKFDAFGGLAII